VVVPAQKIQDEGFVSWSIIGLRLGGLGDAADAVSSGPAMIQINEPPAATWSLRRLHWDAHTTGTCDDHVSGTPGGAVP
jgi:hypothetical protein